jgi:hypothetical protein
MPFCPLPATFRDDLRACGAGEVLELGSGDGRMTALLAEHGPAPWTLDRAGPMSGARPAIRGDALQPPLRARFRVVVAANLVRHLWRRIRGSGPRAWPALVRPDGALWILEDDPELASAAGRNYLALQDLLARLAPGGRGPLLSLAEFRAARRRWNWPGQWQDARQSNGWVLDREAILAWLDEGRPRAGGEVARLRDAIAAEGIACERSWSACWRPEGTA